MQFKSQVLGIVSLVLILFNVNVQSQEIIDAVKSNDLNTVKSIIEEDKNQVNTHDNRNCYAIHYACNIDSVDIVRYLVENGANINVQDVDGDIPISWALARGHKDIAKLLIEKGADLNISNNNGYTLLHWAAFSSDGEIAQLFIDKGVNLNTVDFEHKTALHHAGERENVEVAKVLIKAGADVELKDDYGRTPLVITARQNGNIEIIKSLVEYGANMNSTDKFGDGALTLAAWRGYEDAVDYLLEKGIKIPTDKNQQWSLMLYSVSKNMPKLFNIMIEKEIDLYSYNEEGGKLIHNAAQGGNPSIMRKLLQYNFEINGRDIFGWTPIHYAAEKGYHEIIKLLLENNCDPNKRNFAGESAFNIAQNNNQQGVIELLKEHKIDESPIQFPKLKGDYLGQQKQKEGPELFAKGIVATKEFSHSPITFSPSMDEAFWPSSILLESGFSKSFIMYSKQVNGIWTKPEKAPFNTEYGEEEPFYSIDGNRLYFISERPIVEGARPGAENFWYVERMNDGWSAPIPLPQTINRMRKHWQFSVDKDENIYFSSEDPGGYGMGDIYVSKKVNGEYTLPANLGTEINTSGGEFCPVISPDGSYLIFTNDEVSLCISFKLDDGNWSTPVKLKDHIEGLERSLGAQISPDGEYLFFLGQEYGIDGICWIRIKETIEKLRKETK